MIINNQPGGVLPAFAIDNQLIVIMVPQVDGDKLWQRSVGQQRTVDISLMADSLEMCVIFTHFLQHTDANSAALVWTGN